MNDYIFDDNSIVFIYGAGEKARICADFFLHKKIEFQGFVVSDGELLNDKYINGKKVLCLSEINCNKNVELIVAVSEKYWGEIESEIRKHKWINSDKNSVRFISNTELSIMKQTVKRIREPINPMKFLEKSTPAGLFMGCDRGLSLSRYYINQFLDYECERLDSVYSTYEVGEDKYSSIYFPNANHSILDYTQGNADLTKKETLPCGKFDVFICTQVFNFIYEVKKAIEGAAYVLKEGGVLLATVAGNISQVSRSDMNAYGDYWRFTYLGIEKLFAEVFGKDNISVTTFGNAMSTSAYIQGMCYEDLPRPDLLDDNDPEYALVIGLTARK